MRSRRIQRRISRRQEKFSWRFCALRCIQSVFKIICFVKNDNDHALKYKCKEEWDGLFDESRMFCGLLATLETADRSLKKNSMILHTTIIR